MVITIIVLIILAGVTISMVVGDNGIITKSKEAKKNMTNASSEEKETLQNMAYAYLASLGDDCVHSLHVIYDLSVRLSTTF